MKSSSSSVTLVNDVARVYYIHAGVSLKGASQADILRIKAMKLLLEGGVEPLNMHKSVEALEAVQELVIEQTLGGRDE